MALYKLSGSKNPDTDLTTGVVLERDDDGTVTKEVSASAPADLTKEQVGQVEALGLEVEEVSKTEADKLTQQAATTAATDTAGGAPSIGDAGTKSNN